MITLGTLNSKCICASCLLASPHWLWTCVPFLMLVWLSCLDRAVFQQKNFSSKCLHHATMIHLHQSGLGSTSWNSTLSLITCQTFLCCVLSLLLERISSWVLLAREVHKPVAVFQREYHGWRLLFQLLPSSVCPNHVGSLSIRLSRCTSRSKARLLVANI
mgnify:CR=1 FL=1